MSPEPSNVGQLLRRAAARWPDRVAVVEAGDAASGSAREVGVRGDRRVEVTWGALAARAERCALRLGAAGLGRGSTLALLAHNHADFVATWCGAALSGCTVAPIPTASAPWEVRVRVALADALAVDRAGGALAARAELDGRPVLPLGALCAPWSATAPAPLADDSLGAPTTGGDDPALLLFTSGTTTAARGAVLSHRTLVAHTTAVTQGALQLGLDDVVFGALPFSHSFGCRMVMLACAVSGASMVTMGRFSAGDAARVLRTEGVTWLPAVPTMLAGFVRLGRALDLPALRWCLSAGATLPEPQRLRASAALGAPVYQGYGMTEATFAALDHPPEAPTPGTVGRAAPGVSLRVTDDAGRTLPAGARGEVRVRGGNVFSGYLNDPQATQRVLCEGEVRSGDIGVLDRDGRLRIVDRAKDLILRGGFSVYPSEVESALLAHPDVHQVAVVGLPHPALGEEVVAVVVSGQRPRPELGPWVEARLARTKQPRAVAWVDTLPLGPSRKVLKRTLRAQLASGALPWTPLPAGDAVKTTEAP